MDQQDIQKIGVIGSGTMGSSIALNFAGSGFDVDLYDISEEALNRGYASLKRYMDFLVENGLLKKEELVPIRERIRGCTSLEDICEVQFIIECAPEKLELKQRIFKDLEKHFADNVIFATNTSGLSPTAIASVLVHRERFTASNFWNPAHLLPLVEIMPGKDTSSETVEVVKKLMKKIGKKPVVLKKEVPGYIGNRLQFALLREALNIVDSGIASMHDVDDAVKYGIGRRLGDTGPLETADLGGLHVFAAICESLFGELSNTDQVSSIILEAVKKGDLGYTTGKGIYEWSPEKFEAIQHRREETLVDWLKKDRKEE